MDRKKIVVNEKQVSIGRLTFGQSKPLLELVVAFIRSCPEAGDLLKECIAIADVPVDEQAKKNDYINIGVKFMEILPKAIADVHGNLFTLICEITKLSKADVESLSMDEDIPLIINAFFEMNDIGKIINNLKNAVSRRAIVPAGNQSS